MRNTVVLFMAQQYKNVTYTLDADANTLEDVNVLEGTFNLQEAQKAFKQFEVKKSLEQLRIKRDALLQHTDVYMLADMQKKLSATKKAELTAYRQALRDAPQTGELPKVLSWL